jgi:hypothetical protein
VEWVVDGHLSVTALDDMCASSGLQRAEVFALWARFRALCRLCGRADDVTEAMFRRSVPLLLMEDDTFCHRLFEVCASQYGAMNWRAFLTVIGLLTRGTCRAVPPAPCCSRLSLIVDVAVCIDYRRS